MAATTRKRRFEESGEESGEHACVRGLPAAVLGLMMLAAGSVVSALPEGEERERAQRRLDRSRRARFADRFLEQALERVDLARWSCAAVHVAILRALHPVTQHAVGAVMAARALAERALMGEIDVTAYARELDRYFPDDGDVEGAPERTPAHDVAWYAEEVLRSGFHLYRADEHSRWVLLVAEALPDDALELLDEVPARFVDELTKIPAGAFLACEVCEAPHIGSCTCSASDRARRRLRVAMHSREHERDALRSLAASVASRPGFLWAHPLAAAWDEGLVEALLCEFADPSDNMAESVMRLRGLDFSVERELDRLLGDHGREPHRWPVAVRALTLALAAAAEHEGDDHQRASAETLLLRVLDRLRVGARLDAELVADCDAVDSPAPIVRAAIDLAACVREENGLGITALYAPRYASEGDDDDVGAQAIVRRMLDVLRHCRRAFAGETRDEELRAYLFDGALALDFPQAAE